MTHSRVLFFNSRETRTKTCRHIQAVWKTNKWSKAVRKLPQGFIHPQVFTGPRQCWELWSHWGICLHTPSHAGPVLWSTSEPRSGAGSVGRSRQSDGGWGRAPALMRDAWEARGRTGGELRAAREEATGAAGSVPGRRAAPSGGGRRRSTRIWWLLRCRVLQEAGESGQRCPVAIRRLPCAGLGEREWGGRMGHLAGSEARVRGVKEFLGWVWSQKMEGDAVFLGIGKTKRGAHSGRDMKTWRFWWLTRMSRDSWIQQVKLVWIIGVDRQGMASGERARWLYIQLGYW